MLREHPAVSLKAEQLKNRLVDLMRQGGLNEAIAVADQLTRTYPNYGAGWYTASHLALMLKNAKAGLQSVERALSIEPENIDWKLHKASCLIAMGAQADAIHLANHLAESEDLSVKQLSALGLLFNQLSLLHEAAQLYSQCTKLAPTESSNFYNLATMQRALGEINQARENFRRAIELNPRDYDAWYAQSELIKQTEQCNNIEKLTSLIDSGITSPKGEVQICYALAKEHEDIGNSKASFSYLKRGATLRRRHLNYDLTRDQTVMAQLAQAYGPEMFSARKAGHSSQEPIFIVGLPRTGSTLLERILGNHSEVYAAGELENFPRQMMQQLRSRSPVGSLSDSSNLPSTTTSLDFQKLGECYIDSTRPATGRCNRFIDKLPLNFLYIGLIHLALPQAKIVHIHRDPMDSCYAMYKTLFRDAYPFSYDLLELGEYYLAYRRLMDHWKNCMPGLIHNVRYEDLVSNTEQETRLLLDHCQLHWEDQCLRHSENAAASTTASAVQVRSAIYSSSVGKWRDYHKQLVPLLELFDTAGIEVGDSG